MSKSWYYLRDGVRHGPVSSQQLRALAYARKIAPDDLVWCDGLADWTPAAKVKGLFTMRAPPPPPGPNRGADRGSHVESAGSKQSAPASRPTRQLPEWKEVIAHRLPQVVVIQHSCYIGAGLLISAEGLILTVAHLVDEASVVHIDFADNTVTRGFVIDLDSEHGLALLKAASVSRPFLDLHTDVAESVEAGEAIVAIGHPHGHRFTSTSGIVSAPRRRTPEGILIQHDVPSNPGSSGGPLIDRAGKLVGIVTSGLTDAQGMGFAVPAVEARAYVDRVMKEFVKGKRKVPDDEEILEYGIRIHSAHAVNRALGLFEEVKCIEENSYVVTTSRGTVLLLYSSDEQVTFLYFMGRLNTTALTRVLVAAGERADIDSLALEFSDGGSRVRCAGHGVASLVVPNAASRLGQQTFTCLLRKCNRTPSPFLTGLVACVWAGRMRSARKRGGGWRGRLIDRSGGCGRSGWGGASKAA